ncbi:MAG: hypothetical protein ACTSXP_04760 [Promethearchaeota archaeon]
MPSSIKLQAIWTSTCFLIFFSQINSWDAIYIRVREFLPLFSTLMEKTVLQWKK